MQITNWLAGMLFIAKKKDCIQFSSIFVFQRVFFFSFATHNNAACIHVYTYRSVWIYLDKKKLPIWLIIDVSIRFDSASFWYFVCILYVFKAYQ